MKSKVLTLISVCVVIAISVAFTMPGKKQSKTAPQATKSEAKGEVAGGFAFDSKD